MSQDWVSGERPFVSLQGMQAESASAGHLAMGGLHGSDVCVFTLEESVELPSPMRVEVLICPVEATSSSVIERIRPAHIEVASLQASPADRVVLVRTGQPSRYGSRPLPVDLIESTVQTVADRSGDLRQAILDLGLVPELSEGARDELLRRIDQIELEQFEKLVSWRLDRPTKDIIRCLLSPKCQPIWPPFRRQ